MKVSPNSQPFPAESLQRFQEARQLARQKMEGADSYQKLLDIIKSKQSQAAAGSGVLRKQPAEAEAAQQPKADFSLLVNKTLQKANELLMYSADSKSALEESGKKILGNYVDVMA